MKRLILSLTFVLTIALFCMSCSKEDKKVVSNLITPGTETPQGGNQNENWNDNRSIELKVDFYRHDPNNPDNYIGTYFTRHREGNEYIYKVIYSSGGNMSPLDTRYSVKLFIDEVEYVINYQAYEGGGLTATLSEGQVGPSGNAIQLVGTYAWENYIVYPYAAGQFKRMIYSITSLYGQPISRQVVIKHLLVNNNELF